MSMEGVEVHHATCCKREYIKSKVGTNNKNLYINTTVRHRGNPVS